MACFPGVLVVSACSLFMVRAWQPDRLSDPRRLHASRKPAEHEVMSELTHEAITALAQEHGRDLQRFLTRRLGCPEAAADLLQDTFLRLLQASPKQALVNPRAFLFRIAANLAVDYQRRRQLGAAPAPGGEMPIDTPASYPSAETIVWSKEQVAALKHAIAELPPKCRQVFILVKFHHLSHAAVAARLEISHSTVVKHMVKALEHCKRRVEADDP